MKKNNRKTIGLVRRQFNDIIILAVVLIIVFLALLVVREYEALKFLMIIGITIFIIMFVLFLSRLRLASMNDNEIKVVNGFGKVMRREKWGSLCNAELMILEAAREDRNFCRERCVFSVLYFSGYKVSGFKKYEKALNSNHIIPIIATSKNIALIKEHINEELQAKLNEKSLDSMQYKKLCVKGEVQYYFPFVYTGLALASFILYLFIGTLTGSNLYDKSNKTIFLILGGLAIIGIFLIIFFGYKSSNKPPFAEVNAFQLNKVFFNGKIEATEKWEFLQRVYIYKKCYIALDFSDKAEGRDEHLSAKSHAVFLKKTKRNVKLLREYLPEEFKSCLE